MEIFISALMLGAVGSFHCIGMCGPIALSLPLRGNNLSQKITGALLYNIGRAIMYGLMGAFFGLIGQGFSMVGFQRWISIIMGSLMILSIFLPSIFQKFNILNSDPITGRLRKAIGRLFTVKSYGGLFLIGLLNALLPCGLVYMAIAAAIATGNTILGAFFMVTFGLATLPTMMMMSFIGNAISIPVRNKINRIIPYIVVVIGIVFILRGLSLGIPYLSPPIEKLTPDVHMSEGMKHM